MASAILTLASVCLTVLSYPASGEFIGNEQGPDRTFSAESAAQFFQALSNVMSQAKGETISEALLAVDQCSSYDSCSTCAAASDCHWCGAEVGAQFQGIDNKFVPFGSCQPKSSECAKVQFGTLNKEMNFGIPFLAQTSFKSVEVLSSSKYCTSAISPRELTAENCKQCNELGEDYGWCTAAIKASIFTLAKPAFCLRKELQFLCNETILPPHLPVIRLQTTLGTRGICRRDTPLPPPSDVCSENLSCDTCNRSGASNGCTWCGGLAHSSSQFGSFTANVFGVCIDGADASCDKVTFGTLANYLNDVPKSSFSTKKMDRRDDYCTTVMWPSEGALDCSECIPHQHRGWCQMSANIPIPGHKATAVNGGYCANSGLRFVCSVSAPEYNAKSDWYSESCPKQAMFLH